MFCCENTLLPIKDLHSLSLSPHLKSLFNGQLIALICVLRSDNSDVLDGLIPSNVFNAENKVEPASGSGTHINVLNTLAALFDAPFVEIDSNGINMVRKDTFRYSFTSHSVIAFLFVKCLPWLTCET